MERDFVAVVDFGGQYAHLIAKRIRHAGVYSVIFSPTAKLSDIAPAKGVVLSGGPQSVFGDTAVPFNPDLLNYQGPLLGLCYGHQLLTHHLGGKVQSLGRGEYGRTKMRLHGENPGEILAGVPEQTVVWMSHGDTAVEPPPGFRVTATTDLCPVAAMTHNDKPIYGLQFHPEVNDTPQGNQMLTNFVEQTGAEKTWNMAAFIAEAVAEAQAQVADRNVLMFLSGGVDSTVAFSLLTRALGTERVKGLFIDTGFMRKGESEQIMARYRELRFSNVELLDGSESFLTAVSGLTDPQEKRIAIGEAFVAVRERYLEELHLDPNHWMLGQGTLYPDIIESGGTEHAEVIKSHHNRVSLITELIAQGHVVEPLKELYKDEVRHLGLELGLPEEIVWRHPFPGPGLAINVLCSGGSDGFSELESTQKELDGLLQPTPFEGQVLSVRSVGVQGDGRTYTPPAAVHGPKDWEALEAISIDITNNIRGINRVVTLLGPEKFPELKPHRAFCTKDRLEILREADALATKMLEDNDLMRVVFQLLVILLPLGEGEMDECIVLRPVVSEDVMTAKFAQLDWRLLEELTQKLLAIPGIAAVFYDVTHKPPATFGWE